MVVHPDVVSDLISNIETRVAVYKIENHYNMWTVALADSGPHWMKIFMYVPETETSTSIDKVTAFYTAVNCGIAHWTVNKIKQLVRLSPLFQ